MEIPIKKAAVHARKREKGKLGGDMKRSILGTDSAKVIQVIETCSHTGIGSKEDPKRPIYRYWTLDGKFLAENDCYLEEFQRVSNEDDY